MSTTDATLSSSVEELHQEELHQEPPVVVSQDDSNSGGMQLSGDTLVFYPPLYVQRYQAVEKIINSSIVPVNKVVDIGSAELKFFRNLRNISGVQEVVLVDVNEEILQNNKHRVQPLVADFLLRRLDPFTVKVVCGDARTYDSVLSGAQAVTLIEVIEHMNECDLPALVECVFQHVRPHMVVVTTPNADFNKFFPNHTPGKFRHWDHKFEWTAEEFQNWCLGVVEKYQDYKVEFSGCGVGSDGTFCTQMASFWHHTEYQEHPEAVFKSNMTPTSLGEVEDSPQTPGKFRHWDHKLEWTAEEFQNWCQGVVEEYQDYKVEFSGCGVGPDSTFCTQMASFGHHTQYQEHPEAVFKSNMTPTSLGEVGDSPQTTGMKNTYKIVAEFEFPVDKRTKEERETDYALNRFNSLRNFLITGRQDVVCNFPWWQQQDGELDSLSSPNESTASECINFLTPHFDNEEAAYKCEEMMNEYCFYIIDNRYALIPMRSLVQWVNNGDEADLADELISKAVEDECSETQGTGTSWMGKVMLYEENVSSCKTSDSDEDARCARWPYLEGLEKG